MSRNDEKSILMTQDGDEKKSRQRTITHRERENILCEYCYCFNYLARYQIKSNELKI